MKEKNIDINCDMGEGFGADERIISHISSANIACGFHAGNIETMKKTIELARDNNVVIGAHPGYKDKENFGRKELNYEPRLISYMVNTQVELFDNICKSLGTKMKYIKLHGALYNRAMKEEELATLLLTDLKENFKYVSHLVLSGSKMYEIAISKDIDCCNEVFADRAYNDDKSLVSRSIKGSVIEDIDTIINRVEEMVFNQKVKTINNKYINIKADSICVHGDTIGSSKIAESIYNRLTEKGIIIENKT